MSSGMPAAKLAVSIPTDLLREVEVLRKRRGISRSAVIQIGLRAWVDADRKQERIRRYVKGYQEHPETDEELREAAAVVAAVVRGRRRR